MDAAFRNAVHRARRQGDLFFSALLPEDSILLAFGAARALWQGWVYRVYDMVCVRMACFGILLCELPIFLNEIGHGFSKEPGMARPKKTPAVVEPLQPYLDGVAKHLVDRIYGPQGLPWGTKLAELEDVVIALRQALSEKMLAQALERQAHTSEQRPGPYQTCSRCSGPVEVKPDPEPRNVQTRAGEAVWDEPQLYCRKCRQAFFPSEQEPGD